MAVAKDKPEEDGIPPARVGSAPPQLRHSGFSVMSATTVDGEDGVIEEDVQGIVNNSPPYSDTENPSPTSGPTKIKNNQDSDYDTSPPKVVSTEEEEGENGPPPTLTSEVVEDNKSGEDQAKISDETRLDFSEVVDLAVNEKENDDNGDVVQVNNKEAKAQGEEGDENTKMSLADVVVDIENKVGEAKEVILEEFTNAAVEGDALEANGDDDGEVVVVQPVEDEGIGIYENKEEEKKPFEVSPPPSEDNNSNSSSSRSNNNDNNTITKDHVTEEKVDDVEANKVNHSKKSNSKSASHRTARRNRRLALNGTILNMQNSSEDQEEKEKEDDDDEVVMSNSNEEKTDFTRKHVFKNLAKIAIVNGAKREMEEEGEDGVKGFLDRAIRTAANMVEKEEEEDLTQKDCENDEEEDSKYDKDQFESVEDNNDTEVENDNDALTPIREEDSSSVKSKVLDDDANSKDVTVTAKTGDARPTSLKTSRRNLMVAGLLAKAREMTRKSAAKKKKKEETSDDEEEEDNEDDYVPDAAEKEIAVVDKGDAKKASFRDMIHKVLLARKKKGVREDQGQEEEEKDFNRTIQEAIQRDLDLFGQKERSDEEELDNDGEKLDEEESSMPKDTSKSTSRMSHPYSSTSKEEAWEEVRYKICHNLKQNLNSLKLNKKDTVFFRDRTTAYFGLVYSALFGPEKIDNDEAEDILGISKDTIEQIRRYQRQRMEKQKEDRNGFLDTRNYGDNGKKGGGSANTKRAKRKHKELWAQFRVFALSGAPHSPSASSSSAAAVTITLSRLDKWLRQASVLDGITVTTADTAIVFRRISKTHIWLTFGEFVRFLRSLSVKKGLDGDKVEAALVQCGRPRRASKVGASFQFPPDPVVLQRLTDPTLYGGTHKARFDSLGRGRGLLSRLDTRQDLQLLWSPGGDDDEGGAGVIIAPATPRRLSERRM